MNESERAPLIRHTKESYGDSFKKDLFAQYQDYVKSAEIISERRVTSNNFLLTVNGSLLALYGFVPTSKLNSYWAILVPIAGILISLTWSHIIASYRNLNTVKYKVIREFEKEMPSAPYDYEWQIIRHGNDIAYHPTTHLEKWVPIVFLLLYLGLGVISLIGKLS